jgi:broad-specificity NMP kinase
MKDFIFIAGAPGLGKSTIAKALQQKLDCPLFEFGWIPEFRNTGERELTYTEDEALAFENLVLVAKNYAKHGFKNVIITDLNNNFIERLPHIFSSYDFAIYTLRLNDEQLLKERVMDGSRSSEYRNWEEAQAINKALQSRPLFAGEMFIDVDGRSVKDVVHEILDGIGI